MIRISEADDIPVSAIRGTLEGPSGLQQDHVEYIDLVDDASSDTTDSSRVSMPDLCPEEARPGGKSPQQQRETIVLSGISPALLTKRPKRKRSLSTNPRSSGSPPDQPVTLTNITGQSTSTLSPSPKRRSHGRSSSALEERPARASGIASTSTIASAPDIARVSPTEQDSDPQRSHRRRAIHSTPGPSIRRHENDGYGEEHKRQRMTLEERKATLANDPYVEDFGPTFAVCKRCGGRLTLENRGQRAYYLFNWTKHRDMHIRKGEML